MRDIKHHTALERWFWPRWYLIVANIYCMFHVKQRVYSESQENYGREYITCVARITGNMFNGTMKFTRVYYGHSILEGVNWNGGVTKDYEEMDE